MKKLLTLIVTGVALLAFNPIAKASYPVEKTEMPAASKRIAELKSNEKIKQESEQPAEWNNLDDVIKNVGKSGKSQVTALVLAALVGGLGIHRFYLGYTGIGVIQLLTGGGCGIWAIIDLIRIITGDLKPKRGGYSKRL